MGSTHPAADSAYFLLHPEHRLVVMPFLTCFDVTRGELQTRGNDRLACFGLKPEVFIAELCACERGTLPTLVRSTAG